MTGNMKRLTGITCMIALVAAGILGSCGHEDKSIKLNNPRNIRGVVSYKRSFGDLNDVQLASARRIGIRPISVSYTHLTLPTKA